MISHTRHESASPKRAERRTVGQARGVALLRLLGQQLQRGKQRGDGDEDHEAHEDHQPREDSAASVDGRIRLLLFAHHVVGKQVPVQGAPDC